MISACQSIVFGTRVYLTRSQPALGAHTVGVSSCNADPAGRGGPHRCGQSYPGSTSRRTAACTGMHMAEANSPPAPRSTSSLVLLDALPGNAAGLSQACVHNIWAACLVPYLHQRGWSTAAQPEQEQRRAWVAAKNAKLHPFPADLVLSNSAALWKTLMQPTSPGT